MVIYDPALAYGVSPCPIEMSMKFMVCKSDSLHWVDSINERFCGWLVWISYRENHKKIPGFVCVYLPEWLILVNLCDASWRRDKMPRRCDTFLAGYHFNWDRFYFVADTARIVMLMLIAHYSLFMPMQCVRCTLYEMRQVRSDYTINHH